MQSGHKSRKNYLIPVLLLFPLLMIACNARGVSNMNTSVIKQTPPEISTMDLSPFKELIVHGNQKTTLFVTKMEYSKKWVVPRYPLQIHTSAC